MECYQRCVEAGKRCAFLKSPASCADCGKPCRNNFLITSRNNCRCDTTFACCESKTPQAGTAKAPVPNLSNPPAPAASTAPEAGQGPKGVTEHPTSHSPHPVPTQEEEEPEKQTWWQWLLSLFGFGGAKVQTDKGKDDGATKNYKFQADSHKRVEVLTPQAVLEEVREICDEIKKQKPEPYHSRVEQATSPVAQPQKEEKSSETNLPFKSEEKKKLKRKTSPSRSPNREKYLGRPLDSSPKQKSPRTSPKTKKPTKSPTREEADDQAEKPQLPEERLHPEQVTTSVYLEVKKPPTSPIYSSERYLQPYTSEVCPADPTCQECCHLSASTQTNSKSLSDGGKKKSDKHSKSGTMACMGSPCLMCGSKSYPPRNCASKGICGAGMNPTRRPTPSRPTCPSSPACFALEEVTRNMRRRRRSASPCGRGSSFSAGKKRSRSSSCPPSPRCPCSPCCPRPCFCGTCPPPCCPPVRCSFPSCCKPCPCPKSCLPPPLCKTCCHLASSISKTPPSCCPCPPSPSANNKPAGCRVGPGCPCPITCTKPCCVPTCFPTPKQPCKAPAPSAYNQFHTFRSFAMKSYSKSRDNDALCRQLMARYKIPAPDSVPFCPKPRTSICGPCGSQPKIQKQPFTSPTPLPGCSACGACSGCNNNKLTSNNCDSYLGNYGIGSQQPSAFPNQMCNAPITFNTSPSHSQPKVEFRIPKRTPVRCIKEMGPRSPCKEFMSTFNFPKVTRKYNKSKDAANSLETASTSDDKDIESSLKSNKKSRKQSPSKPPKRSSTERQQTSGDQDNNVSENKAMTEAIECHDTILSKSVLSWRASTQRVNARLKAKLSPRKQVKLMASRVKETDFNEEEQSARLSPLKYPKELGQSKYRSQNAQCLISNIPSPIQKSSHSITKQNGTYDDSLYSRAQNNFTEGQPKGSELEECYGYKMKSQQVTRQAYPIRTTSPLSQQWSSFKYQQSIRRRNRKQLSPPAVDIFPRLKFSANSKLYSHNPVPKSSFHFSKVTDGDDSVSALVLKSPGHDAEVQHSLTECHTESTASKDLCHAQPEQTETKYRDAPQTLVEMSKTGPTGVDKGISCLTHDTIDMSPCLAPEPLEAESVSLLVKKYDRVEVNADGSMAPSNCNVFDYISAESSLDNTSKARDDDLSSHEEELSVEAEEDKTEVDDILSLTEEKHDPVIELEYQTPEKATEFVEMSNVGTTVDCVHGDNVVSKDTKAELIAMQKNNDASVKVATAVNNSYNIPLFNLRLDLIPQRMDLLKFSDLVLAGESSVDPAEFGYIGESAVDPIIGRTACLARESSLISSSETNHSNNNQTKGDEPNAGPGETETSEDASDVTRATKTSSDSSGSNSFPSDTNSTAAKASAGDTVSGDSKPKSSLDELLSSSGVKWRKVTQSSDVDLKLLRLSKTAFNMKRPPVLNSAGSIPDQGTSIERKAATKPYLDLLKPGEVESWELSTNADQLLCDSSTSQVLDYGTPV